jgi:hypothetical protein
MPCRVQRVPSRVQTVGANAIIVGQKNFHKKTKRAAMFRGALESLRKWD